jgi:hypothetical protein
MFEHCTIVELLAGNIKRSIVRHLYSRSMRTKMWMGNVAHESREEEEVIFLPIVDAQIIEEREKLRMSSQLSCLLRRSRK